MPYKYNPNTGGWNHTNTNPSANKKTGGNKTTSGGGGSLIPPPELEKVPDTEGAGKVGSGGLSGGRDDKTTGTKSQAEKRYLEVEYQLLKGDLEVVPDLDYRARVSLGLDGLGRYLSGVYYVDSVTTHFGTNSLSQKLSVLKSGFGDTVKIREQAPKMVITDENGKVLSTISTPSKVTAIVKGTKSTVKVGKSTAPKKPVTVKTNPQRTHILKPGESLWSLAQKYYKNGNKWKVIAKANNISEKNVSRIPDGKKLIIP